MNDERNEQLVNLPHTFAEYQGRLHSYALQLSDVPLNEHDRTSTFRYSTSPCTYLTYISAFTDKIEEYIDLAMQDARPPSLLERISTPIHASAPPTDVSVSNSDEEDPNHPGGDWIKFDIKNTKHYPLVFINENGKEELAQYICYLSLGDGITLQGWRC